jgi:hypothetical protein
MALLPMLLAQHFLEFSLTPVLSFLSSMFVSFVGKFNGKLPMGGVKTHFFKFR